jgi:hypothetical protein
MYKLAVEDVVEVPVKFTLKNKGVNRLFSYTIICDRLPQEVINERLESSNKKVTDFMREVMTGWRDQRLVLLADDSPADFNDESCDVMLNAAGVGTVLFNAYFKECGAKEKN